MTRRVTKPPTGRVRAGCSGFTADRAEYARLFPFVEEVHTFIHPPPEEVLERWRAELPKPFEFVARAWQLVTHSPSEPSYHELKMPVPRDRHDRFGHFRWTDEVRAAWQLSVAAADTLQAPILLLVSPRAFDPTPEHESAVRHFLSKAPRGKAKVAWHPPASWAKATVEKVCRDHRVIAASDPFDVRYALPGVRYFRLPGRAGRRSRYSGADFARVAEFCAGASTAYVAFSNAASRADAQGFVRALAPKRKR